MASGKERGAGMARVLLMLAGTALATGCQTLAGLTARAQPARSGGDCFNATAAAPAPGDVARLQKVAVDCAAAANNTDSIRQRTTALFHAGTANAELGRYYLESRVEGLPNLGLPTAADQLDLVVRSTNYVVVPAPADGKKPKTKPADAGDIPGRARLELARVYSMQGRYPEAIATLENMLKAAPAAPNAAAKLALAKVYLARSQDGALADGSLEKAVGYLEVFASDLKTEDPAVVREGRTALVDRASQLGLALMSGPVTRESSQRAIDALTKAEAGAVAAGDTISRDKVAAIHTKLGQAKLRMAGLPVLTAPTGFDCAAPADSFWLGQARASFTTAVERGATDPETNAEANAGMGCARQAISFQTNERPTDSIIWFERAAQLKPQEIRYKLQLARALGASDRDARPVFQQALALAGDDRLETSRIHVEIAKIHLQNVKNMIGGDQSGREEQLRLARESANLAIAADDKNGAAHLMLGKALYEDRKLPGYAMQSKRELDQAATLMRLKSDQRPLYAETLYYRSLLGTEVLITPTAAVRDAIDAVNTVDKPEYKEQACLALIRFLNTSTVADGKIRCVADEIGDPMAHAKALLMEGMFYLKTTSVPGINKDTGWEWALRSFEKGSARLGQASAGEDASKKLLRSKLTVGEAISYSCVGLKERGKATMSGIREYQAESEQYFQTYTVGRCYVR